MQDPLSSSEVSREELRETVRMMAFQNNISLSGAAEGSGEVGWGQDGTW